MFSGFVMTIVMVLSASTIGFLRTRCGGKLLQADRNVRDALNGVGVYILVTILALLHIDLVLFAEVLEDNFGAISVNASFALVILTRLEAIVQSARMP